MTVELAIVGAGPTASSLLERIGANVTELLGDTPVRIHLVDPHRAGTGRVWRADNHAGLWMNSLAEDVTMFTDESVTCEGPIRPGPSLYEWSRTVGDDDLAERASPELIAEIRALTGTTFPTRRVQSVYLDWFHRRVVDALPANVEIVVHRTRAADVVDLPDGRQRVELDDGETVTADVVVLALGHLDAEPEPSGGAFAELAARRGLTYVPAGHTAELDFSDLQPGEDVIALGFGQAFTDLLVMLTEGRGGRFVTDEGPGEGPDDGSGDGSGERTGTVVRYEPSGAEPVIHVGSRRGVPYRSKMDYRLQGPPAELPQFLTEEAVADLVERHGRLEFRRDVYPLVRRDVGWAAYHELFHAHPERARIPWEEFTERYRAAATADDADDVARAALHHPEDVFDIARIDRPLAGLQFAGRAELERHVRNHVAADVARKTDPTHSADLGAFLALLRSFGTVGRLAVSRVITERSRVEDVNGWWFSFFMYYASGPPPARLRQLLALQEAGLVRFIGAGTTVHPDAHAHRFVATSTSHPEEIGARALVHAVVAAPTLGRTADALLQRLRDRGEAVEEVVTEGEWQVNTGKVVVATNALRVVDGAGVAHPRRHALGAFTSRPAAGAFSRPRTNAPAFRQNDAVARVVLGELAAASAAAR